MKEQKKQYSMPQGERDFLEKYLYDISKEKQLSQEEEKALSMLIKKGDQKAKEQIVKANLKHVVQIAKKYQHLGISIEDLINEGNIGLIKAAEHFDGSIGIRFISYASNWIRQSIMQSVDEQKNIIKIPNKFAKNSKQLNKEVNKFVQENERRPIIDEIASQSGLSEQNIAEMAKLPNAHVSIDAPLHAGNDQSYSDRIASDDDKNVEDGVMNSLLKEEVKNCINTLSDREKRIIEAFYGINRNHMTFAEIANAEGITRERARQIRKKALRKLRSQTSSKILKSYLSK